MDDVVDAIRNALTAPAGVVKDDSLAEPMDYAQDRLYAWPEQETYVEEGDGSIDRGDFSLWLALTLATNEADTQVPLRPISLALSAGMKTIATWVRDHRADTQNPRRWEDLQVSQIQYGGLRGFEHRGHRIRLTGYRQVTS